MAKDILQDSDGDVYLGVTGIEHTAEAEPQLLQTILDANKGLIRHSPMLGAGMRRVINSPITQADVSNIYRQLELDNWTDENVYVEGKKIIVEANHE